jgi:hypothetical protein
MRKCEVFIADDAREWNTNVKWLIKLLHICISVRVFVNNFWESFATDLSALSTIFQIMGMPDDEFNFDDDRKTIF